MTKHNLLYNKIAECLRTIGNKECLRKAEKLEKGMFQTSILNFRNLDLSAANTVALANILKEGDEALTSISFSYNHSLGDEGAIALANNLPESITEIGLVDCGIGELGGAALLNWVKKSPKLRMVCFEQNKFSTQLKMAYRKIGTERPHFLVVV